MSDGPPQLAPGANAEQIRKSTELAYEGVLREADIERILRWCLCNTLGLEATVVAEFNTVTRLFGALPELDSMATAALLGELEDRLVITVDDIDGNALETFGALMGFVLRQVEARAKRAERR